ncbi:formate dehydrogenase [Acidobacteria bacterium Mor1]|nr:formate dehydrogenase [Acidobacteria bacterium Mor1]
MSEHDSSRGRQSPWDLSVGPPPESWDDWVELDPKEWPKKLERHYRCVPTICFNCESACGLLAFVDKRNGEIVKFEGNPVHPGSRGRTCAKGPATINQVKDPERILKPLKRNGPRGSGKFVETTWEEALEDIGGRIREAIGSGRHDEVMYHVGRPGDDHFIPRLLNAWGVDGHNSHTTVCSASARTGFAFWCGADRPSPDYSCTKFALLLSSHLETGHYFNPHAQRIMDAKSRGARIGVVDTRLSNTSTHADLWISPWPGSEAALLLGVARNLIVSGRIDRDFVERWTNWEQFLGKFDSATPAGAGGVDRFLELLAERYARYTPEYVAEECRIPGDTLEKLADEIAAAGSQFTSHLWRNTAAGNLGGWQTARSLLLLHVLTGSFGTPGGLNPNSWDKITPAPSEAPPAHDQWNELIWPREYPLGHYEMSHILPHLMEHQDKRLEVYFTRVYNPVWTNPDGCTWIQMLEDPARVGCHVALTPIWSETAQWADYVLPMGLGPERHDLMSQETHAGTWIGFRQPVPLQYRRLQGEEHLDRTLGTNPGQVWEEAEFWIDLTWKIDPDGSMGIRRFYESKQDPGSKITLDEYYADIFESSVPGLPEAAAAEEMKPLEYMRRYGAFAAPYGGQRRYEQEGFPTPSKKLEVYSPTLEEWGWEEHSVPEYQRSHVHWRELDEAAGEMVLLPTFRLPTLIHTRSGNAKWLQEISHSNPLWVHPVDAERLGVETGDLCRVKTRIGYFVPRVWVTEGIHPGIVACSHHVGRWRTNVVVGGQRMASSLVDIERGRGTFRIRHRQGAGPYASNDPDTKKVWWHEVGVNQNLTFAVQTDPVSGMQCWHQRVFVLTAEPDDRYGDVFVDTHKSREAFKEWLAKTRPAPGPGGLRRPLWLKRPLHPKQERYYFGDGPGARGGSSGE